MKKFVLALLFTTAFIIGCTAGEEEANGQLFKRWVQHRQQMAQIRAGAQVTAVHGNNNQIQQMAVPANDCNGGSCYGQHQHMKQYHHGHHHGCHPYHHGWHHGHMKLKMKMKVNVGCCDPCAKPKCCDPCAPKCCNPCPAPTCCVVVDPCPPPDNGNGGEPEPTPEPEPGIGR